MKLAISVAFTGFILISLYMSYTWQQSVTPQLLLDNEKPKISVRNLKVFSYDKEDLAASFFVTRGELLESGIFNADQGVKSIKYKTKLPSSALAEKATVQFLTSDLDKLMMSPEYNEASMENNVQVEYGGLTINGQIVYFDNIKKLFYSSKPIRIKGIGRSASSRDGFVYDMIEDHLKMTGKVEGVIEAR